MARLVERADGPDCSAQRGRASLDVGERVGPVTRLPTIPAAAAPLLAELTRAAAETPTPLPCQRDRDPFTSEVPEQRARAAAACEPWPIRGLCDAYARTAHERWGVWGDVDRAG